MKFSIILFVFILFLASCDTSDRPIDAETKRVIDSLVVVGTRQTRAEMDTLCKKQHTTVLPHLVDSIMQKRKKEIEAALKTVPSN